VRVRGFVHVLQALRPRLGEIVLAGGWAWYLYRKYLTDERGLPGEFTLDVDLALPRGLSLAGDSLDKLLAAADFETHMQGDDRPPITTHSWPSFLAPEAIVEFLTPARGSGESATLEVSGVVAQQLRFIDLLLDDPLTIDVNEHDEEEAFIGSVRVPRVGLFVLQKSLTYRRRRERQKRFKDLFYVFDLVDQTRQLQESIGNDVRAWAGSQGPSRIREAATFLQEDCGQPESEMIGRVLEQIPPEQRPLRRYLSETFLTLVQVLEDAAARASTT
jgi:hypothetical protein